MATGKFCSPFGKLSLSLDEKKELCRTAKRIVRETIEEYERFLHSNSERLNPARWAVTREREDVRVYHDRRPGAGTEDKDLHVLLTVGTVVGSLNDAMYGVLNHTTEAMRLKTAYVQDTVVNCSVLATVQEPKADKPFRSLTVKWLVKGMPLAARVLTKLRDIVYIEATGMKRLSNGEKIGFHLLHSVKSSQTPSLPQYLRGSVSSCAIWRQKTADRVQTYSKCYLDVPERVLTQLVIRSVADGLISLWRNMHCAQMKKLAWLIRRKTPLLEEKTHAQANGLACDVCGSVPSSSSSFSSRRSSKSVCVICTRHVCATCCVKRDLCSISAIDAQLLERRVAFCVPCLTIAVRADAAEVATDEIPGARLSNGTLSELIKVVGTRASCPMDMMGRTPSSSSKASSKASTKGSDRGRRSLSVPASSATEGRRPVSSSGKHVKWL